MSIYHPKLFHQNKYTKWYVNIIKKAKSENRKKGFGVYYEAHHEIPQCFGGTKTVLLTAREHYIAHTLLVKMCIDGNHIWKMQCSLYYTVYGNTQKFKSKIKSRTFQKMKEEKQVTDRKRLLSNPDICGWNTGIENTPEQKKKIAFKNSKKWKITTPENDVIIVLNMQEFCRENNLHAPSMSMIASGKLKHHKGYICERISDYMRND